MKTLAIPLALILAIGVLVPIQSFAQEESEDNGDFQVEVSADQQTISRGSQQVLNVEASEESDIIGSVTYASDFVRAFSGSTDDEGTFTYEWRIGGNSLPGTFKVLVIALGESDAAVATTTFEVTAATPETDGEEPIPPVDNGTISEGNGTVIVPEEPVPLPVENGTAGNETIPDTPPDVVLPVPTVNETIPIPVPVNGTIGNETIPVPLPINTTTGNETVPVPELPTNETIEQPVPGVPTENDTDTGPIVCVAAPCDPDTGAPLENQTETLPDEIPAANETTTVPIPIPVNQSTGNETIPVPEIPVEVNETGPVEPTIPGTNATVPGGNATEPEPTPPVTPEPEPTPSNQTGNQTGPITPETPPEDVISILEERTEALENQSASQEEVFIAVGEAVNDLADAVNTLAIFPDQREEIRTSIENLQEAIADLD